eukprot:scaffold28910_cov72-Skeletonema_dohrnii-CCMP3373.AAC.1
MKDVQLPRENLPPHKSLMKGSNLLLPFNILLKSLCDIASLLSLKIISSGVASKVASNQRTILVHYCVCAVDNSHHVELGKRSQMWAKRSHPLPPCHNLWHRMFYL